MNGNATRSRRKRKFDGRRIVVRSLDSSWFQPNEKTPSTIMSPDECETNGRCHTNEESQTSAKDEFRQVVRHLGIFFRKCLIIEPDTTETHEVL